MRVNLNDSVRARLNRYGKNVLVSFYSPVVNGHIQDGEKYCDTVYPQWRDGVIETQLWNLFEIFGPKLRMGGAVPFELNEIEILEKGNK